MLEHKSGNISETR